MRRNSLGRWKKFSTKCRHLCISVSCGNGRCAIRFGWDHGNSAPLVHCGAQGVVVESFVGDESLEIEACDQRFDADAVVTLAGQQDKARQVASESTRATILVVSPPRDLPIAYFESPFTPVPCQVNLDDRAVDERVF